VERAGTSIERYWHALQNGRTSNFFRLDNAQREAA
jgi:hypothetical protein